MRQIENTTNPDELFEIGQKYMASGNYDVAFCWNIAYMVILPFGITSSFHP